MPLQARLLGALKHQARIRDVLTHRERVADDAIQASTQPFPEGVVVAAQHQGRRLDIESPLRHDEVIELRANLIMRFLNIQNGIVVSEAREQVLRSLPNPVPPQV